jgi:hypothetical protein
MISLLYLGDFFWQDWIQFNIQKVWHCNVTELPYKRLIQPSKYKRKFHYHFPKFLLKTIYESATRTATRSTWQVIGRFVIRSTSVNVVITTPFNTIFSKHRLRLGGVISIRNYHTKCTTRPKSDFSLVPCRTFHISLQFPHLQTFSVSLCHQLCKYIWLRFPNVQNGYIFIHIMQ